MSTIGHKTFPIFLINYRLLFVVFRWVLCDPEKEIHNRCLWG